VGGLGNSKAEELKKRGLEPSSPIEIYAYGRALSVNYVRI